MYRIFVQYFLSISLNSIQFHHKIQCGKQTIPSILEQLRAFSFSVCERRNGRDKERIEENQGHVIESCQPFLRE